MIEVAGWIGALGVLGAYLWITYKGQPSIKYHLLNFASCVLLIINTIANTSYPSAFVNIVWCAIAVLGMLRERSSDAHSI